MPSLQTFHFGLLEYAEEQTIQFDEGLPAFERERRFVAIEQPATAPIIFLQSLLNPGLAFMTVPALFLLPGYQLNVAPEDLTALGLNSARQPQPGHEVLVLAIITVNADGAASANLLAPVLVNLDTRQARQVIQLDTPYACNHPLEQELAPEQGPCS
ncbi:MAG: flagellar assembly protein FliW [Acidimicrobiia bacterium]|nr:flagellar assembly protein FliW [Acidimicrobiia bacterium]